ncbi:hypothetical protein MNBD_NITROSPINAE04-1961 [hydrothermal vent metagenome]|uniref:C1q domain-containing protein n=1 Tax=hydrothermal vent metagenome TaxID=652676 RepID=A0A3B1BUY8_9ZZZZ
MPIQGITPNRSLTKITSGSTDNWDVWYNDVIGKLDEPTILYQISVAENMSDGDVAVILDDGFGAKKAYKATSATYTFGDPLCMVTSNVIAGNLVPVVMEGKAQSVSWSFGAGDRFVYLSASGTVTTTQANDEPMIGFVVSSSSIYFNQGLGFTAMVNPSFSAHKNGASQVGIGSGTWTLVTYPTENYDTANAFDISTSRFSPKVAGKYFITAHITWTSFADLGQALISIYKNGSAYRAVTQGSPGTGSISVSITSIVDMNGTTDFVEIYAYQESGASRDIDGAEVSTSFAGSKIS